ncbi:MAG: LamG-like jellyroll fold domain-containing protein [Saprospiraceae bacterium]
MKFLTIFFSLFLVVSLSAQTNSGLVAFYTMNDGSMLDNTDNGSNGTLFGTTMDDCGVENGGIFFGGENQSNGDVDHALILGPINNNFNTADFTISFHIKPRDFTSIKDIISKREDCTSENAFAIQYVTATNSINVVMSENSSKQANVSASLDFGRCWQHVMFVRKNKESLLYINGTLRAERSSPDGTPINIQNNAVLSIASSPCLATLEVPFIGVIDELYFYKKALNNDELAELKNNPHEILTKDQTIFQGESVDIEATESCNVSYQWTPSGFLNDDDIPNVTATPDTSISYVLSYTEDQVCIAYDTINITVIDPDSLDCDKIFLPKAFTPNGDNLNDRYGISNPFAIQELLSFEIFDRWGSRVFFTENAFDQWDGSFKGKMLNPGVLLYRIRFSCDGEEQIDVGSLAIMR